MDALPEFRIVNPKTLAEAIAARADNPTPCRSAAAPISWSISAAASSRRRF